MGGPGESLVESLVAADLADERPGRCTTFCEPSTPHPVDYAAGLAIAASVGAGYRFPGPFSVDAVVSNGARGHTDGYNHTEKRTLVISYSTFLITTTLGVHLPVVGLHAGPVVARTSWEVTENSVELSHTGTFTVGGTVALSAGMDVGEVNISVRSGLRVFPERDMVLDNGVGLRTRYRAVYVGVMVRGGG